MVLCYNADLISGATQPELTGKFGFITQRRVHWLNVCQAKFQIKSVWHFHRNYNKKPAGHHGSPCKEVEAEG